MQIYLVGGAVRDTLLHYPFVEKDWVVVGARPEQLLAEGYQQVGNDFPVFLHPETKEEYALARTERKSGYGYNGFEFYAAEDVTLEEDLIRRDLSINAMAMDEAGTIYDPYNGQADLDNKILRHVSPAFAEDPLRVLRVARFYARYHHLGFTIADETLALMQQLSDSGELAHLSNERIWKETERALSEQSPAQFFIALKQCLALEKLFPFFSELKETQLSLINSISYQDKETEKLIRFALLFAAIPNKDKFNNTLKKQLKDLKIPNNYIELAVFMLEQLTICENLNQKVNKADNLKLLQLLESIDPFRRFERFTLILNCLNHLNCQTISQLLLKIYEQCKGINAAELAAQGLTGKAIGEAIKQQRLTIIESILD